MNRSSEGSIYRTQDKNGWFARLRYTDKDGRHREKKRRCPSHAAAKATIQKLKSEIESENSDRQTYRQLDEYFRSKYVHEAKFVSGQKLSGFRQDIKTVERYLDRALEHFTDRQIDSITYADLQNYKHEIASRLTVHGKQRSMSDINHHLKRLRRLLTVAVEQGWLVKNPFNRGGSLIEESFEVERTRILSVAEETRLISACNRWRRHLKPLIVFAVETGCRRGEIKSLIWENVNFEGRSIRVTAQSTKTLKSRLVPMSARLAETLAQLRQNSRRRQSDLVFTTGDFKTSFNKACFDAGLIDVHFHDLRHTGTSRMIAKGIPIADVMKITGHTQMKTFLRYVNQSESSVYEIALRLDRAA